MHKLDRGRLLWLAVVALATAWMVRSVHDVGHLGQDTYLLIASAQVDSPGDVGRILSERFLGGFNWYRPVLTLSVSLDHALWGMDPGGYARTGALLWGACALALGLFVRAALGPESWVAALVAVLAFCIYPCHGEVLPILPRRGELLLTFFALMALRSAMTASRSGRVPWAALILAVFAFGSKDNGVLVVPLAILVAASYSPGGFRTRVRYTAHSTLLFGLAGALFWWGRSHVVHGVGGRREFLEFSKTPERFFSVLGQLLQPPQAYPGSSPIVWIGVTVVGALLLATWIAPSRGVHSSGEVTPPSLPDGPGHPIERGAVVRLVAFASAWSLLFSLIYSLRGSFAPRYLGTIAVGLSLGIGVAAQLSVALWSQGHRIGRLVGGTLALPSMAFLLMNLSTSTTLAADRSWVERTESNDVFYTRLRRAIERSTPGEFVELPGLPKVGTIDPEGPHLLPVRSVVPASILAWAKLEYPDRRTRIVRPGGKAPRPGELVLVYRGARLGSQARKSRGSGPRGGDAASTSITGVLGEQ